MGEMVGALNYSTHAIEDMNGISALLPDGNLKSINRAWVQKLRKASKFILPPGGDLLDVSSFDQKFMDLLRLPFPIVALEYPTNYESDRRLIEGTTLPDKNIILAWEEGESIVYTSINLFRDTGKWFPADYVCQTLQKPTVLHTEQGNRIVQKVYTADQKFAARLPMKIFAEQGNRDLVVLLEFCCTVNCDNVKPERIPAPEKLNKKRIANGREPFDSCYILTIPSSPGDTHEALHGTHASPRLHLRRGHLRRLPSGKVIWVRHCMVGNPDKGVVEKIYRVSSMAVE